MPHGQLMPCCDVYESESRLRTGELGLCAGLPGYTPGCLLYICFPFSMPLYTPALPVLIYLFVVHHCMCFVLRPNFPHETLTYPGPACSKDRLTDNVPALGTAICIAARKGRRPEGSI